MSRVGKQPIPIPSGVDVQWDKVEVRVKGPKGRLATRIPDHRLVFERDGDTVVVRRQGEDQRLRAFHGLIVRLVGNMVTGVTEGFRKELEIQGVGYRAQMQGNALMLNLGFSHPVEFAPPEGVTFEAPTQTQIVVSGIDKQAVGQAAAEIRRLRPPEPYKGKGVRYRGEYVRILEGKKTAKA